MMRHRLLPALLPALFLLSTHAAAGMTTGTTAYPVAEPAGDTFLPAGALSYEETRLDNGLRIISQRVHGAPYISARLVTRTGTEHYPCRDRELPHLVEHLLFSANGRLAESEIDDAVSSWGGSINAYTYDDQTDIVLDAHARYQAEALQLLATMVGEFAPEDADIAREAGVVERESGIGHSPLRLWWSGLPATMTAGTRFSIAAGLACTGGVPPVHHLRTADVRAAFDTYYVPANMILVIAGDLDDAGLAAAREAFASLPARPAPVLPRKPLRMPDTDDFTSGWLSGTANLDAPSALAVMPFHDWEGYYVMLLAEDWLNDRLFRDLRSERGIAYTPSATLNYHGNDMSLVLHAQTDSADTDWTLGYLRALTEEVRRDGISEEEFAHLRQATLLGMAQSLERISDRADYLAGSVREIEAGGLFQMEAFYRQLDYPRFRSLLSREWPQRFVVIDNSPRVSWQARAALLISCLALLLAGIAALAWRRWRDVRPG